MKIIGLIVVMFGYLEFGNSQCVDLVPSTPFVTLKMSSTVRLAWYGIYVSTNCQTWQYFGKRTSLTNTVSVNVPVPFGSALYAGSSQYFVVSNTPPAVSLSVTRPIIGLESFPLDPWKCYELFGSYDNGVTWRKVSDRQFSASDVQISVDYKGEDMFRYCESSSRPPRIVENNLPSILSGTNEFWIDLWCNSSVRYASLLDIYQKPTGEIVTNTIGVIDIKNQGATSFIIDTSKQPNGTHTFMVEEIDHGVNSDVLAPIYSMPVTRIVENEISVSVNNAVEYKLAFAFRPSSSTYNWSVSVTNSLHSRYMYVTGSNASTNSNGYVVISDESVERNNVYPWEYFDIAVRITRPGLSVAKIFRLPISGRSRIPVTPSSIETIVVEGPPALSLGGAVKVSETLGELFVDFTESSIQFNLQTQTREDFSLSWNVIEEFESEKWRTFNRYLLGEFFPPTHLFYFGVGGPDSLGRESSESDGVSTATLSNLPLSNRVSFAFLTGLKYPRSILSKLGASKSYSSREEAQADGIDPRVVFYWNDAFNPFASGDIPSDVADFLTTFSRKMWEINPWWGLPANTIREALDQTSIQYPNIATQLRWIGDVDHYIDETWWTF